MWPRGDIAMQTMPKDVLDFWLNDVGPKGWFAVDAAVDEEIIRRFTPVWRLARTGGRDGWLVDPAGALALLIVLDQFPRNMFRGDPRSFDTDPMARRHAKLAIAQGRDMATAEQARILFYLPFMHSEGLGDQDRSVRLITSRMGDSSPWLLHARAHREVIRRFGRFPYRNDVLRRETTAAEAAWLAAGGYRAIVDELAA
jgi:uncharacterized protein (DUF924 family)